MLEHTLCLVTTVSELRYNTQLKYCYCTVKQCACPNVIHSLLWQLLFVRGLQRCPVTMTVARCTAAIAFVREPDDGDCATTRVMLQHWLSRMVSVHSNNIMKNDSEMFRASRKPALEMSDICFFAVGRRAYTHLRTFVMYLLSCSFDRWEHSRGCTSDRTHHLVYYILLFHPAARLYAWLQREHDPDVGDENTRIVVVEPRFRITGASSSPTCSHRCWPTWTNCDR